MSSDLTPRTIQLGTHIIPVSWDQGCWITVQLVTAEEHSQCASVWNLPECQHQDSRVMSLVRGGSQMRLFNFHLAMAFTKKKAKKNETWGHAQGQRAWALISQFSSQGFFHSRSSIFRQRSELGSSAFKVIWRNFTQASVFPGLGFNGGWGIISGWWNFPEMTWSRYLANPVNAAQLYTY